MTLPTKCPICGKKLKPGWLHCPMCVEEQPKEAPVSEPIEPEPVHVRLSTDPALPEVSDYTILSIRAIDADAFTSISNAEITIQGPTSLDGITNTEGLFEARSLESGLYTVSASAPGFEPGREDIQINGEANLILDIALKARTGTISGRVLDRTTLQPVSQAHVFIDSARIDRSVATNADGAFELADIPPGPYTTCADSTGYTPQTRLAEVEPGGHVALSFALETAQEDNEDAAN